MRFVKRLIPKDTSLLRMKCANAEDLEELVPKQRSNYSNHLEQGDLVGRLEVHQPSVTASLPVLREEPESQVDIAPIQAGVAAASEEADYMGFPPNASYSQLQLDSSGQPQILEEERVLPAEEPPVRQQEHRGAHTQLRNASRSELSLELPAPAPPQLPRMVLAEEIQPLVEEQQLLQLFFEEPQPHLQAPQPLAEEALPLAEEPPLLAEEPQPLGGDIQPLPFHAPREAVGMLEEMQVDRNADVLVPEQQFPPEAAHGSSSEGQPIQSSDTEETRSLLMEEGARNSSADSEVSEELTSFILGGQIKAIPAMDESAKGKGRIQGHKGESDGNVSPGESREIRQQEQPGELAEKSLPQSKGKSKGSKARTPKISTKKMLKSLPAPDGNRKRQAMLAAAEDTGKERRTRKPVR